ncbi:hypothetical protein [Brevibacillus sp. SYSU BS000544]|uniref:hypothetical protein n=1 Tax=Brevibacillus sp. SYSU BS000544 TaxID=3416443 RepID=UPI003CE5377C
MTITKYDDRLILCMGQLLRNREYVYQADSVTELTEILEAVSLQLEDREVDFQFTIDGQTVTFQLADS